MSTRTTPTATNTTANTSKICFHDNVYIQADCLKMLFMAIGVCCAVLVAMGTIFNIITLASLHKMKLNAEVLFLFKCLTAFDIVFLESGFLITYVAMFSYWLGYGTILTTEYLFVDHYVFRPLYRISSRCSYWLTAIMTLHR